MAKGMFRQGPLWVESSRSVVNGYEAHHESYLNRLPAQLQTS